MAMPRRGRTLRVVRTSTPERPPSAIVTVGDLLDDLADDLVDVGKGKLELGAVILRLRSRADEHRTVPL